MRRRLGGFEVSRGKYGVSRKREVGWGCNAWQKHRLKMLFSINKNRLGGKTEQNLGFHGVDSLAEVCVHLPLSQGSERALVGGQRPPDSPRLLGPQVKGHVPGRGSGQGACTWKGVVSCG